MTPAEMAELHRAEPTGQRAWSETEFSAMLSANNAVSVTCDAGFAVGQVIVDEAELFLIMTKPEHRKQGVGHRILATVRTTGVSKRSSPYHFRGRGYE